MRWVGWCAALVPVLLVAGCADARPGPTPPPTVQAIPRFPSVPGRVLDRTELAHDDWQVRIRVDDADVAYASAKRRLVADGFVLTKDRAGTGGGDGQACTSRLCVSFGATEGDDGATLTYEVFRGGGIVG